MQNFDVILKKGLFFFFLCVSLSSFSQNIEELSGPINSDEYHTIAPYVSYDGNSIVFIKQKDAVQLLVECKKNNEGIWGAPTEIDAVNKFDSVKFIINAPVYNHDASEIYFSLAYDKKDSNSDIYITKKVNGIWLKPEKMPTPINSGDDETDPFLSNDGKFFFFAKRISNDEYRKFECFQIFVSEKVNGTWRKPVALPEPVNSGCDKTPRLSPDGKTLYFSSVRNGGNTYSDLYYAKKITKNAWTSPVLIDTLNIFENETYPSVPLFGEYIYFQLGKPKKKDGIEKLVKLKPDVQFRPENTVHFYGIVTDLKSKKPLSAKIHIIDPNSSIILNEARTNELTGEYSFFLPKGKNYRIDVFNDHSSHFFFYYDAKNLSEFIEIRKDIKLYPEIDLIVNVFDNEIFEPLSAGLFIYDAETGNKMNISFKEFSTGRFKLTLPIGKHYKIEGEKVHFENNYFELDLRGVVQFSEFERDLELQVKKVDYELNLSDIETGEGVEATVEITNLTTNEKIIETVRTGKDGKLKIKLRDGTRYDISVTPKGYAFYNTTVDLVDEDAEYVSEVKLVPLKRATKLELNDINFETNSADLNNSSFEELDRLVKLLVTNPEIKIQISAHTDDVGSNAYNLKLSQRRAGSVKEYLFSKEITEDRIISKGFGENKPAYLPFDTEENRAKNRRVELLVTEIINI